MRDYTHGVIFVELPNGVWYSARQIEDVHMKISGVILAGGRNSRMGCRKAFLEIGGKKMIDVILGKLRQFFAEVIIVTDKKGDFVHHECRVIEDIIEGCGPLGGVYTGLREIAGGAGFFVGCDMPYLHERLVSRLIAEVDLARYECIVPKHSKGIEPLHAIYSRQILPKVERALSSGKLSFRELFADCSCKYIDVDETEISSFVNINTPEDLAHCQDL